MPRIRGTLPSPAAPEKTHSLFRHYEVLAPEPRRRPRRRVHRPHELSAPRAALRRAPVERRPPRLDPQRLRATDRARPEPVPHVDCDVGRVGDLRLGQRANRCCSARTTRRTDPNVDQYWREEAMSYACMALPLGRASSTRRAIRRCGRSTTRCTSHSATARSQPPQSRQLAGRDRLPHRAGRAELRRDRQFERSERLREPALLPDQPGTRADVARQPADHRPQPLAAAVAVVLRRPVRQPDPVRLPRRS